jgi:putative membrane protein
LIMLPQIGIGAYIALSDTILYDVYAVCGRAWPISPLVDQQIGGLITWIPASMMSVIGILIVLRLWMRDSRQIASVELMEPSTA